MVRVGLDGERLTARTFLSMANRMSLSGIIAYTSRQAPPEIALSRYDPPEIPGNGEHGRIESKRGTRPRQNERC